MSKRLQVLLDEAEWREIQRAARAERMTVAEWVRGTLRAARRRGPGGNTSKKLAVVRTAARHAFPTADIPQMLAEIERGYLGEAPRDLPCHLATMEHHEVSRIMSFDSGFDGFPGIERLS